MIMMNKAPQFLCKSTERPDLETSFLDGSSRNSVILLSSAIGIGTYNPGWRWSLHAGAITGKTSERHIGFIISGEMMVRDSSGNESLVHAGEAFEVAENHDAWVVGDEPCVALDFTQLPH
ncbi:TPA: hypothetical protein ACTXAG_005766 [Klebsiella oxytoca]